MQGLVGPNSKQSDKQVMVAEGDDLPKRNSKSELEHRNKHAPGSKTLKLCTCSFHRCQRNTVPFAGMQYHIEYYIYIHNCIILFTWLKYRSLNNAYNIFNKITPNNFSKPQRSSTGCFMMLAAACMLLCFLITGLRDLPHEPEESTCSEMPRAHAACAICS